MTSTRQRMAGLALLAGLLSLQGWLLARLPNLPPRGDESYHLRKANALVTTGALPRADAAAMAIERGERWGTSDYRPPGYPVLLALASGGDVSAETLRPRMTALQFAGIAVCLVIAYFMIPAPRSTLAALILGAAPWTFEYASSLIADSPVATLSFVGIAVLATALSRDNAALTFVGALVLSATLLLRPDMILMPPAVFAAALLFRRNLRHVVAMACAFVIPVAAQYAYRVHFTGETATRLYAPFHLDYEHALAWSATWIGTEKETVNFVWTLGSGRTPAPLPPRAWSDAAEKAALDRVIADVGAARQYRQEHDAVFAELRAKRRRDAFFTSVVLSRLWHAAHLWLNPETNTQTLHALAPLPRPVRRVVLGGLLLAKLLLLALFARGAWLHRRSPLIALCAVFVIARTAEIGLLLNVAEHRYVLAAWVPLLVCASAAVAATIPSAAGSVPPAESPGSPDNA